MLFDVTLVITTKLWTRVGYAFNIYPFLWPSKNGPSQTEAQVVMDRPLAYINLPIKEVKKGQQQFALQFTPPIIQLFRHFVKVVNCSTVRNFFATILSHFMHS